MEITELVTYGASPNKDTSRPYLMFADLRHFTDLPTFFCEVWTCLRSLTNSSNNVHTSSTIGSLRHGWLISARLIVISHQVTSCHSHYEFWPVSENK